MKRTIIYGSFVGGVVQEPTRESVIEKLESNGGRLPVRFFTMPEFMVLRLLFSEGRAIQNKRKEVILL